MTDQKEAKTTEVTLNGHQRLSLSSAIPQQGCVVDLQVYRELKENLSLSSDELLAVGFDPDKDINQITIAQAQMIERTYAWSDSIMTIIRRTLRELEQAKPKGKLPDILLDVYLQHVEGK